MARMDVDCIVKKLFFKFFFKFFLCILKKSLEIDWWLIGASQEKHLNNFFLVL